MDNQDLSSSHCGDCHDRCGKGVSRCCGFELLKTPINPEDWYRVLMTNGDNIPFQISQCSKTSISISNGAGNINYSSIIAIAHEVIPTKAVSSHHKNRHYDSCCKKVFRCCGFPLLRAPINHGVVYIFELNIPGENQLLGTIVKCSAITSTIMIRLSEVFREFPVGQIIEIRCDAVKIVGPRVVVDTDLNKNEMTSSDANCRSSKNSCCDFPLLKPPVNPETRYNFLLNIGSIFGTVVGCSTGTVSVKLTSPHGHYIVGQVIEVKCDYINFIFKA